MSSPMNSAHSSWEAVRSMPIRMSENRSFPLRRLYFLDFPLVLLSFGFLGWLFPTDAMLAITSFVGAAIGSYLLWEMVIRQGPLRIFHFSCVALIAGYGIGALSSWLTIDRNGLDLAQYFNKDTQSVTQAMATVLITGAVLCFCGEMYEKPIFKPDFRISFDSRGCILIFSGTLLLAIGFRSGSIGYMGGGVSGGHIGFFSSFLLWFAPACFAFTTVYFLNWPKGILKWMMGIALAAQFLMCVPMGRRNILYVLILAILATRLGDYRPRWSLLQKVFGSILLACLLAVGATAFFYLRAASGTRRGAISLFERIDLAIQLYESGSAAKINAELRQNLQKRTFVIGYFADLLDASSRITPALGADALHEIQLSIPSAFWENKDMFLYQEESVANEQFGFSFRDESNSILTAGALDFGFAGVILYPILLCTVCAFLLHSIQKLAPTMAGSFVALALMASFLQTEAGLSVLIVVMRNSILFAFLLGMLARIPRLAWQRTSFRGARQA